MKYNIDPLVRYKNFEVQSKEEALAQIIKGVTECEAPCELSRAGGCRLRGLLPIVDKSSVTPQCLPTA